jgi:tRNA dimethylallyltransferase
MQEPLIFVVQGPTASGKTALAIALAQHFNTEIISFDSRQFYKEMSIGTAVPSNDELSAVPHHFIQHASFKDAINASQFEALARPLLKRLLSERGVAVLVGGSALFADALIYGLDDLPHDPVVQRKWQECFKEKGLDYLQAEFQRLDPEYFSQIDLHNSRRLIRALEVFEITGVSNAILRKGLEKPLARTERLVIDWPREQLYARINERVDVMLAEGLEVEAAQFFPVYAQYKTLNTVGYTEFFACWKGELDKMQVPSLIKQHTRNYAKRQLTWMRRYQNVHDLNPLATESLLLQALDRIG